MENQGASARLEALSLVDMASAFVVFGLGISLSILSILFELVYKGIKETVWNIKMRLKTKLKFSYMSKESSIYKNRCDVHLNNDKM